MTRCGQHLFTPAFLFCASLNLFETFEYQSRTMNVKCSTIASGPSHVLRFLGFIGPLDFFHLFDNFLKRNTSLHDGVLLQIRGAELSAGLGVNGLKPSFFLAQRPLPRLVRVSFRHCFLLVLASMALSSWNCRVSIYS